MMINFHRALVAYFLSKLQHKKPVCSSLLLNPQLLLLHHLLFFFLFLPLSLFKFSYISSSLFNKIEGQSMDELYEPRYTCIITEPNDTIFSLSNASSNDGFILEFQVKDRYENLYFSRTRNLWVFYNITTGMRQSNASFFVPREELLSERGYWEDISIMLQLVNVPLDVHINIIPKIKEFAVSMANDPFHAAPDLMPILVDITKWSCVNITDHLIQGIGNYGGVDYIASESEDELFAQIANITLAEMMPRARPAAQEAIDEMLKKVTVEAAANGENDDEMGDCAICFEEYSVGLEVTELPCKHLFHEECILPWLKRSNMCPLCRFALPVAPN